MLYYLKGVIMNHIYPPSVKSQLFTEKLRDKNFQLAIAMVIDNHYPEALPYWDRRDLANDLLFLVHKKIEEADDDTDI